MKTGDFVTFRVPCHTSKSGTRKAAGTIKRIMPDGKFEVKAQQGGYYVMDESELTVRDAFVTAHTHEYVPHHNSATHHVCRLCGFSCPNYAVPKHLVVQ